MLVLTLPLQPRVPPLVGLNAQPDQPSGPPFLPWPRPGLRRACQRPSSAEGPSGINSFNSVSILQCSYKVGIIIRHLLQIQKLIITDSRKGILDLRVRPRARLEPSAAWGRSEKHQVHARGMADSSPPDPAPQASDPQAPMWPASKEGPARFLDMQSEATEAECQE